MNEKPQRTLVAGFGNVFRRDDGAGPAVVNALRARLGRTPLAALDDGFDDLGHAVDTVVLHQLVPELAETVKDYGLLIFVDAHVGNLPEDIRVESLDATYTQPFVSHQIHPSTVLSLAQQMYGRAPRAVLLSLRGYDFDFGEGLSPQTAALVTPAVAYIQALLAGQEDAVVHLEDIPQINTAGQQRDN